MRFLSSRHSSPVPPSPLAEIVGDVDYGDGRLSAFDAHAANHEVHPILSMPEDMLDIWPHFRRLGIRSNTMLRHRSILRLLSVDLTGLADTGQERFVGRRSISCVRPSR